MNLAALLESRGRDGEAREILQAVLERLSDEAEESVSRVRRALAMLEAK